MSELVSKWLSTKAVFYKEEESKDELYEQFKDDPIMLKAHGFIGDRQKNFAPQLIDIDEVIATNPAGKDYPNCTTVWFVNTSSMIITEPYEKMAALLLKREQYLEESKSEFLKLLTQKIGL